MSENTSESMNEDDGYFKDGDTFQEIGETDEDDILKLKVATSDTYLIEYWYDLFAMPENTIYTFGIYIDNKFISGTVVSECNGDFNDKTIHLFVQMQLNEGQIVEVKKNGRQINVGSLRLLPTRNKDPLSIIKNITDENY